MEKKLGKRFIFSAIAIVCGSVVTIFLKYPGSIYVEIVKWICLVFVGGQTVTDVIKKKNGGKDV